MKILVIVTETGVEVIAPDDKVQVVVSDRRFSPRVVNNEFPVNVMGEVDFDTELTREFDDAEEDAKSYE